MARASPPVKLLLVILTGLLVLVNAFFVIAEYSLVRSRRARLQAMVEEGASGVGGECQVGKRRQRSIGQ